MLLNGTGNNGFGKHTHPQLVSSLCASAFGLSLFT